MILPPEIFLFLLLIAVAIAISQLTDLFAAAMLTGMFSLLSAGLFTLMDAVDVAFTEAAVGAGISTVLILGTLSLTANHEDQEPPRLLPFLIVIVTGGALIYGTLDMPHYGDVNAPIHQHVARKYIENESEAYFAHHEGEASHAEVPTEESHGEESHGEEGDHGPKAIGLPNIVTSVLASYRGYDTMGETAVIFTAGIGVLMLLGGRRRRQRHQGERQSEEQA